MKAIISVILEAIAATTVIVFCLFLPQAFDFPRWAIAMAAFPILLYLSWRLGGRPFTLKSAALVTAGLAGSLYAIERFAPASFHIASILIVSAVTIVALVRLQKSSSTS